MISEDTHRREANDRVLFTAQCRKHGSICPAALGRQLHRSAVAAHGELHPQVSGKRDPLSLPIRDSTSTPDRPSAQPSWFRYRYACHWELTGLSQTTRNTPVDSPLSFQAIGPSRNSMNRPSRLGDLPPHLPSSRHLH